MPPENSAPYRIDKFKVPPAARGEFREGVLHAQEFLRTLPGFVRHALFEQPSGTGVYNFVTIAEWESTEAIEAAKKAVEARYKASGYNPQALRARLGIEGDEGIYTEKSSALSEEEVRDGKQHESAVR